MKRWIVGVLTVAIAGLAGGAAPLAARQNAPYQYQPAEQNQPGMPTIARMYVLNHERSEAVPVTIQNAGETLPVAFAEIPTVMLAPTAVVATHESRQMWEYKQVPVRTGQDPTAELNTVGAEGWEAVGTLNGAIVLKRPR